MAKFKALEFKEIVKNNGGNWDMTNEKGMYQLKLKGTDLPITDLYINGNNDVCACIPLYFLDADTLNSIYELINNNLEMARKECEKML